MRDVSPFPQLPLFHASLRRMRGLSGRLMALTIGFVLLAEILIFVPSIANYRNTWLGDRLAQARVAALVLDGAGPDALPRTVIDDMLRGMDTTMIALRIEQSRRLLASLDMPPMVDFEIDLRQRAVLREIINTFDILLRGGTRTIRVVGAAPGTGDFVEIVLGEARLRDAMLGYARSILLLSLLISAIVASLLYLALDRLIIRPIRSLSAQVEVFRQRPEDAATALPPVRRTDEIGSLHHALSEMQQGVRSQLRQREHLARLGLAVSRINHDLRNMLSSAQLLADRLGTLKDETAQRLTPRLLSALDRAIAFCQSTLSYARAEEREPVLRPIRLKVLITEIVEQQGEDEAAIRFHLGSGLEADVQADEEFLHRILTNLIRNGTAVLAGYRIDACITVAAVEENGFVTISVADNGPGLPEHVRVKLFEPFGASTGSGGTGLGLSIAHDLTAAMGGSLTVRHSSAADGTVFDVRLPKSAMPV